MFTLFSFGSSPPAEGRSFHCKKCDKTITKESFRNHCAAIHQSRVSFPLSDGTVFAVERGKDDGMFACPKCHTYRTQRAGNVKAHVLRCRGQPVPRQPRVNSDPMWCQKCNARITEGTHYTHQLRFHQITVSVLLADGTRRVVERATTDEGKGLFVCPVCEVFKTPWSNSLRGHTPTCQALGEGPGAGKIFLGSRENLVDDRCLDDLELAFNTAFGLLICQRKGCGYILDGDEDEWQDHVNEHLCGESKPCLTEAQQSAINSLRVRHPQKLVVSAEPKMRPVQGLFLQEGYACPSCPGKDGFFTESPRGFMAHHSKNHGKAEPGEKLQHELCHVQFLASISRATRVLIRVRSSFPL